METVLDEMGPEKIVQVYDPKLKFHGFLVIDSSGAGAGRSQIRFTQAANMPELSRLARTMTLKNALAGLPLGGAYSHIIADPAGLSPRRKKEMVQSFAQMVRPLIAAYHDEDSGEHTGLGAGLMTMAALAHLEIDIARSEITIAGYSARAMAAHTFLQGKGAKIVAVSDSNGTAYDRRGLDFNILQKIKQKTGSVLGYPGAKKLTREVIYELSTDALVATDTADAINETNVTRIKANCIIEAVDMPIREEYEKQLHKKDILIIPDILANSAGAIAEYAQLKRFNLKKTFKLVEKKVMDNITHVLEIVGKGTTSPRDVAVKIAKARLKK